MYSAVLLLNNNNNIWSAEKSIYVANVGKGCHVINLRITLTIINMMATCVCLPLCVSSAVRHNMYEPLCICLFTYNYVQMSPFMLQAVMYTFETTMCHWKSFGLNGIMMWVLSRKLFVIGFPFPSIRVSILAVMMQRNKHTCGCDGLIFCKWSQNGGLSSLSSQMWKPS